MSAEGPSPKRAGLLVLAYLALLGLIPLASRDREARWHARNGLVLFGIVLAAGFAATAVGILFPALFYLYAATILIVSMAYFGIVALAIVTAVRGQRLMIPWVSPYASRLSAKD